MLKTKIKSFFKRLIPWYYEDDGQLAKTYINIFGLKLLYRVRFKPIDFASVLNHACDITLAPKARGKLRRLQLADVKLLKIFDLIAKKHGIPYYLGGGTLLGAFRHKGMVPWDDDVDVCVPRECREKVQQVLEQELKNTKLDLWGVDKSRWDATLRISHKDFEYLNLDIFYSYCFTDEAGNREAIHRGWSEAHRNYCEKYQTMHPTENRESLKCFRAETDAYYASLVKGMVDFYDPRAVQLTTEIHWHAFRLIPMSAVLPFSQIQFEDMMCPAPHDPLVYLKEHYDVYSYPSHFDHHGDTYLNFEESRLDEIEKELDEVYKRLKNA